MRPVDKGQAPREYSDYADAGPDLQDQIGGYCSYCERYIETHLAVEHVRPKKPDGVLMPGRLLDWDNFLLACVHCNSRKGDEDVELADYLWPDSDNTFRAFEYRPGGIVAPSAALDSPLQNKAEAMMRLVGLDVDPGHPVASRRPSRSDERWLRRKEAWQLARLSKSRLSRHDSADMRDQIVDTAASRGMFSIWMKAFEDDADMRERLIRRFAGTASDCFDDDQRPVPRPGGQC
jgi:uncharacterized protein (TIGR02646 family)